LSFVVIISGLQEGHVSQVRKGILNGWKEIGGYVGRDIRTVERWEKQRGLPVRRVPGAGRATVYALIAELDEWLVNSKPEGKEAEFGSEPELQAAAFAELSEVEPVVLVDLKAKASPVFSEMTSAALPANEPGSPGFVERRKTGPILPAAPDRLTLAGIAAAVGFALIWLLAWPVSKSHAKNLGEPKAQSAPESVTRGSRMVRGSQVAGVDALYLRGIYFYEQRTPESLGHSLNDFKEAIAKDPNYAPAYAGLANTYNLLREYSVMPEAEAYAKAREAAERAVALDPTLPDAHAALGFIDFFWSWDAAKAESEFRTALALDSSSAVAHHWYGSMLMHEGRFDEALKQLDIAQRLDPTSTAILSTRAFALGLSGHRGQAEDMLQDVLNETPDATSPHATLAGLSKIQPRDPTQFLVEMRRVAELRHSDEMLRVAAAAEPAYRSGGEPAMWGAIFAEEAKLHPGVTNKTYLMVEAEALMGRKEDAMTDLTELTQRRDPQVIGILIDPSLSTLHSDPRFGRLVASVGLPPLQR
jgi:Tfp pilus assembly protein PilF